MTREREGGDAVMNIPDIYSKLYNDRLAMKLKEVGVE